MKIIVDKKDAPKPKPFPKLMIAGNGHIVLFYANRCGVNVVNPDPRSIDPLNHSTQYIMERFTDFTGTITLSND